MNTNQNPFRTYTPQQVVNQLSSFVNTQTRYDNLFQTAENYVLDYVGLHRFDPLALSRLVWSYASGGYKHPRLFNGVAKYIVDNYQLLNDFDPAALSIFIWAFAKADHRHRALFEVVATHICQLQSLDDFNSKSLSNVLWAYARVDHVDTQLFNKVAIRICSLKTLNNSSLQTVATLVWSSAKVGCYHEALFDKIASYIVHDKNLFATEANMRDITMLIWAYATVESSNHPVLFESLTEHVLTLDNLDSFSSFALTNLIWGLNQFTTPPTELLYKVIDAAVKRDEAEALVRICSSLFPNKKEICLKGLTNKCTGRECGKLHLDDDTKLLEVVIKHRWEKLVEEGMYSWIIYILGMSFVALISFTLYLFNSIQRRKP